MHVDNVLSKDEYKITVITCAFNAGETIERTIQSVLNQTYPEIEYLIIDGGSTDNTLDIIKSYQNTLYYWVSEPDQGLYHAMNKGIQHSSGDYLYFLNADDWLYDKKVFEELSALLYKTKPDVLFGRTCLIYSDYQLEISRSFTHKNLRKGVIPPHQGCFIKKTTLDQIGYFNTSLSIAADLDLMCRLINFPIGSLETNEVIAYVSAGGASSEKSVSYQEVFEVINKYYGNRSASIFYFRKIVIEQGIKKGLNALGLNRVYYILARVNNIIRNRKSRIQ